MGSYCKYYPNEFEYCHRGEHLVIVNIIMLMIPLSNQMSFICLYLSVCAPLPFEDLFTPNEFNSFRWVNQCPYVVDLHGLYFEFHGFKLFLEIRFLHCIYIGDRILIVLIEFDGIILSDQEIVVSVQLMRYSTGSP